MAGLNPDVTFCGNNSQHWVANPLGEHETCRRKYASINWMKHKGPSRLYSGSSLIYTFCLFILWLFRLSIHGSWWKGLTGLDRGAVEALKYWKRIFRIPFIHGFLQLFLFHANLLSAPAWRWLQLCKLQGSGKEQDSKRLIASVAGISHRSRRCSVIVTEPIRNPPRNTKNSPPGHLSTCQLSMFQVI